MNWRRGLFRVWLVFSAIWAAATVYFQYQYEAKFARETNLPAGFYLESGLHFWPFWITWVIGPPVGLAIVALVAGWTIRGFRKS